MRTSDLFTVARGWPPPRAVAPSRTHASREATSASRYWYLDGAEGADLPTRGGYAAAPVGTTVTPRSGHASVAREPDPAGFRSDSARWLDAHLVTILAMALAAPAFWVPTVWIVACGTIALGVRLFGLDERGPGPAGADLVVVPARAAGRALVGLLNPLVWLDVLMACGVVLVTSVAISAATGALRWVFAHGTDGVLAAARLGAWAYTPRVAAAGVCFVLVRGTGRTAARRALLLAALARRVPERALAALTVVVLGGAALLVFAGPRASSGPFATADGLGWLPAGLRASADAVRDKIVDAELAAVTACLVGHQPYTWASRYTAGNLAGAQDVARLTADPEHPPAQVDAATAALALHNQLASWVERIEIAAGDTVLLTLDRRTLPRTEPLTDATRLVPEAVGAPAWLAAVAPTVPAKTVLDCSAHTPL